MCYDDSMNQTSFGRELLSIFFKAIAVLLVVVFTVGFLDAWYYDQSISDGECNIAVLPIEGVILPFASYAEYDLVTTPALVRDFIERAETDPFVKGVMFEINSPGGTPVASAEIAEIIRETELPTVALIGDIGTSGGYLAAAGTDHIIASPMSDVGSIGVTMSYLEYSKQNEEEGITFVELNSGRYKDIGNPNRPLSEEERALLQADLDVIHDEFVTAVANLRSIDKAELDKLADGLAMPGRRALEHKLVDELGGRSVAKRYLSGIIGIEEAAVRFCGI